MTQSNNLEPMTNCPRFPHCSVPICPLDRDKGRRVYLRGEPKCTLAKAVRAKLGKMLPWKGLTPSEFVAWKRWQNMSPNKRSKFVSGGDQTRFQPDAQK